MFPLYSYTQAQVSNGIPLPTCLYLFNQWVCKLHEELGVVLMEPRGEYCEDDSLCALVTWSDWDLEICLGHECSRKRIKKRAYFEQWIDIRAVYRVRYL
jgi:ERI1 exoribonuclease 2